MPNDFFSDFFIRSLSYERLKITLTCSRCCDAAMLRCCEYLAFQMCFVCQTGQSSGKHSVESENRGKATYVGQTSEGRNKEIAT